MPFGSGAGRTRQVLLDAHLAWEEGLGSSALTGLSPQLPWAAEAEEESKGHVTMLRIPLDLSLVVLVQRTVTKTWVINRMEFTTNLIVLELLVSILFLKFKIYFYKSSQCCFSCHFTMLSLS